MFNLSFFYKNVIRFISFLKDYNLNFYDKIFKINKLVVYFNCYNIVDINQNSILSSIFFFKYYFGILPVFSNYKSEFKLNIYYYNFFIEYVFKKEYIYFIFLFFLNDIYGFINKIYVKISTYISF
jgi:hypothetical protein